MKRLSQCVRIFLVLTAAVAILWSQVWPAEANQDRRLPSGRSQREAILEMEYEKTLKDAGQLLELAEELKAELEKNDRHVLSISSLKKAEEIEKLAKRIRKRLKRS